MELSMSLLAWCQWLEHTPLATAISAFVESKIGRPSGSGGDRDLQP